MADLTLEHLSLHEQTINPGETDTIAIAGDHPETIEIISNGGGNLYISLNGQPCEPAGEHTFKIPAGGTMSRTINWGEGIRQLELTADAPTLYSVTRIS